jgi:hypothetical protein
VAAAAAAAAAAKSMYCPASSSQRTALPAVTGSSLSCISRSSSGSSSGYVNVLPCQQLSTYCRASSDWSSLSCRSSNSSSYVIVLPAKKFTSLTAFIICHSAQCARLRGQFATPRIHLCELPKQFAAGLACQVQPFHMQAHCMCMTCSL